MSSDFSPEVRNSAWWSGDSRKAANGKASEAILTKLGLLAPPDLSGVEAVQMGHVMEPVILELAAKKLGSDVKKIDHAISHPKELWLKSHFDGVTPMNELVEAKNYNTSVRHKFDADAGMMPPADLAQCVHEACVFGTDTVYLAVLFGGQEFVMIKVNVTEQMKEDLIKDMAVHWAKVVNKTIPDPSSVEEARVIYPHAQTVLKVATSRSEQACVALKQVKGQIKLLEQQEEVLQTLVMSEMGDADSLVDVSGTALVTWKNAKASMRFDAKLFEQMMPDVYKKFVYEAPGSRRFLVK
jgi:predicted phage-related endonuclease